MAPLSVVRTLSGALLAVLEPAVERALRRAPAGDVGGFTGDPLFSDEGRQQALASPDGAFAYGQAGTSG